jgi:hypothetical protein
VANENDSGSTNEDEEEEACFMQLYARLSQENKAVMLKLLERAREQSEARQRLEDVLSIKMLIWSIGMKLFQLSKIMFYIVSLN